MCEDLGLEVHSVKMLLFQALRCHLFLRRTKADVAHEVRLPPINERTLLLRMTDVERGVYLNAARDTERQRQICCHLQIHKDDSRLFGKEVKTLAQIRETLIEHQIELVNSAKERIAMLSEKVEALRIRLAKLEADMAIMDPALKKYADHDHAALQTEVGNIERSISYDEDVIADCERIKSYMRSIDARNACAICFDPPVEPTLVRNCAHVFCYDCVSKWIEARRRDCPLCRTMIKSLVRIASEMEPDADSSSSSTAHKLVKGDPTFAAVRDLHGTKVAVLIRYIREALAVDPTTRMLIFSQFDGLLHRVGFILAENGIPNVWTQGNVHTRRSAIERFRSAKIPVMMLSLEKAASGTNLTEASHIIILDPYSGTPEEVRGVETQAIGRVHRFGQTKTVEVVRLVVEDTVEEDVYRKGGARGVESRYEDLDVLVAGREENHSDDEKMDGVVVA
ncbi:hypothetical protein HDU93_001405 [Gonapodya sp. JEL0774]|nr:hypothetical protein HDU93_001405 [Gonapodya sp. JEL0774]